MREYFRKGFISLYTTSLVEAERVPSQDGQWHGCLSEEVRGSLDAMVTVKEIKEALWSMKPYKSPGPDGLHAGFYQRFWLIVGDSVIKEVMKVFLKRKVPDYLNKTLIALIPKVQSPETLGNYRPISLVTLSTRSFPKSLSLGLDLTLRTLFLPSKQLSFRIEEEQIMLS